jgi:hemolysin activation/secretion protein
MGSVFRGLNYIDAVKRGAMRYKFWLSLGLFLMIFSVHAAQPYQPGDEGGLRPSDKSVPIPENIPDSPGIDVLPQQQPAVQNASQQKTIELDEIKFDGNSVVSTEELNELVRPYLHKPVSVDEIEELRRLVTHHYIDKGYITSGATFPAKPIQGKTLRIKIVEGRLADANIKGTGWLRDSYVKNRLIPDPEEPLNMKALQEKFRLLLSDPLFDHLNGRLVPGADRGLSVLDLEVVRARPYQFSAIFDNYRSPSVGAEALGANGWVRNLTGQGDLLDLTFMSSEPTGGRMLQYSGNWLMPIADYGTKAYFSFSRSNSSIIEEPLATKNMNSQSFSVEGGLNQVMIDSLQRRLAFGAGVGFKQNETTLLGKSFPLSPGLTDGKSQVSFVRVNQEYIERWEKVAVALRSTFTTGLDSFGATINGNNKNPDSNYFAWLGQTQGVWNLPYAQSRLVFKGTVQLSDDPLLPLERIAVGGHASVRGYRENQLVRDNGYTSSVELHVPLLGDTKAKYRFDVLPFFDSGAAWNNPSSAATSTVAQNIYSTGVGFQFQVPHFGGEFYWAHRLNNDIVLKHGNLQDEGIHFQARVDAF